MPRSQSTSRRTPWSAMRRRRRARSEGRARPHIPLISPATSRGRSPATRLPKAPPAQRNARCARSRRRTAGSTAPAPSAHCGDRCRRCGNGSALALQAQPRSLPQAAGPSGPMHRPSARQLPQPMPARLRAAASATARGSACSAAATPSSGRSSRISAAIGASIRRDQCISEPCGGSSRCWVRSNQDLASEEIANLDQPHGIVGRHRIEQAAAEGGNREREGNRQTKQYQRPPAKGGAGGGAGPGLRQPNGSVHEIPR